MLSLQKDDLDGEIDLKSCVKVSEFDVEKNYGFQIQVNPPFFRLPDQLQPRPFSVSAVFLSFHYHDSHLCL